jgi:hypothetical protein
MPAERDRLLVFTAAELARARRSRGLKLNVPESIAIISDTVAEAARWASTARGDHAGPRYLNPDGDLGKRNHLVVASDADYRIDGTEFAGDAGAGIADRFGIGNVTDAREKGVFGHQPLCC